MSVSEEGLDSVSRSLKLSSRSLVSKSDWRGVSKTLLRLSESGAVAQVWGFSFSPGRLSDLCSSPGPSPDHMQSWRSGSLESSPRWRSEGSLGLSTDRRSSQSKWVSTFSLRQLNLNTVSQMSGTVLLLTSKSMKVSPKSCRRSISTCLEARGLCQDSSIMMSLSRPSVSHYPVSLSHWCTGAICYAKYVADCVCREAGIRVSPAPGAHSEPVAAVTEAAAPAEPGSLPALTAPGAYMLPAPGHVSQPTNETCFTPNTQDVTSSSLLTWAWLSRVSVWCVRCVWCLPDRCRGWTECTWPGWSSPLQLRVPVASYGRLKPAPAPAPHGIGSREIECHGLCQSCQQSKLCQLPKTF